jgi:hypothetical protein
MSRAENIHEREVATALHSSGLLTIRLEVLHFSLVEGLLAGPLEGFCPGVVSENILK